ELLPGFSRLPLLRDLVEAEAGSGAQPQAADAALVAEILGADEAERPALVASFLQQELARVLEIEPDDLDVEAPLTRVGLDSLMALELKNRVETALGIELPVVGLIEDPTIAKFA